MKLRVLMAGLSLLASSLSIQAQASSEVYIHLQPRVLAAHKLVALKDIATVVGDDSAWVQQPVIKLDGIQRLTQQQLEQSLLKQFPQLQGRLVWGGAAAITVEGSLQSLSLDAGIEQARLMLEQHMERQTGRRLEYKLQGKYKPLSLPAGKVTQHAVVEQVRWMGKRVELPLHIYVDQQLVSKRQLVFVQRALGNESSAQPLATLESPSMKPDTMPSNTQPASTTASAIQKNQQVRVLIQHGPIQIESEGLAQDYAEAGQAVMVKRLDNQETFMAQALQPGVVIVKE